MRCREEMMLYRTLAGFRMTRSLTRSRSNTNHHPRRSAHNIRHRGRLPKTEEWMAAHMRRIKSRHVRKIIPRHMRQCHSERRAATPDQKLKLTWICVPFHLNLFGMTQPSEAFVRYLLGL